MPKANKKRVLLSGASIAGPMAAFWLHRYGFEVTIVERAPDVRLGGYPIDIRGAAIDVVERTGVLDSVNAAHIGSQRSVVFDPDGAFVGIVSPAAFNGNEIGRDVELARGDLTTILYDATRRNVEYIFNDSITDLDMDDSGVDVTFKSNVRRRFDLVIGTDGLHSNVRRLVFGPEEQFEKYIGYYFALFSMPNYLGMANEMYYQAKPGKAAMINHAGKQERVHALLPFQQDRQELLGVRTLDDRRGLLARTYADWDWEVPRMLEELSKDEDPYFDSVSQVYMPCWSKGRVALGGDAAHATSFLSGQGTSVSLIGAYILAGEIASHLDHATAFENYERIARPFIERNQALVGDGRAAVIPSTEEEIKARNERVRAAILASPTGEAVMTPEDSGPADEARAVYNSIDLPHYDERVG